jgi:hypothetical protein
MMMKREYLTREPLQIIMNVTDESTTKPLLASPQQDKKHTHTQTPLLFIYLHLKERMKAHWWHEKRCPFVFASFT